MALTPPTYSAAYAQAEQNANAVTICGFIDAVRSPINTQASALLAMLRALQSAKIIPLESGVWSTLDTQLKALITATT